MKTCSKCNTEKPLELFSKNHVWCKSCVKVYDHNYHKKHATRIRTQKKVRRKKIRQWIIEFKSTLNCNRCPENHFACLTFHHTDPTKKDIEIANAVRDGWSKENILAEVAKCEVLCANCHLKHHFA